MIIKLKNQYFKFADVPGDGNCLFHSLARSGFGPDGVADGRDLRMAMANDAEKLAPETLSSLLQAFCEDKDTLLAHLRRDTDWGTNFDFTMFAVMYGVDVVAFSVTSKEIALTSAKLSIDTLCKASGGALSNHALIGDSAPTVYVFHHFYSSPMFVPPVSDPGRRTPSPNHYAHLEPIDAPEDKSEVFEHDFPMDQEPSFFDLTTPEKTGDKKLADDVLMPPPPRRPTPRPPVQASMTAAVKSAPTMTVSTPANTEPSPPSSNAFESSNTKVAPAEMPRVITPGLSILAATQEQYLVKMKKRLTTEVGNNPDVKHEDVATHSACQDQPKHKHGTRHKHAFGANIPRLNTAPFSSKHITLTNTWTLRAQPLEFPCL